ncbi:DNA-binding transcriptional regulator, AcrR family [Actinoplanes philippinensis]|uniref:DNA-binding transcriptional regulator, AcrR family n=1 Tax=Actinoplanes philippinensis TaxID=35752 RepID=A0A1I2ENH1_9ACTN|nr:DNA-binding transcriptional regulator, AcrR family [Actinoplanes philippinensis]
MGLKARLVQVGVDLLAREGIQALTLREIARQAGVSHGAPRRHFPTHLELLSAIAREGFLTLTTTATETIARSDLSARAKLGVLGRAYLDFARDNPGMFELMSRHDLLESNRLGLRETSLPLFALLVDLITEAGPPGGNPPRMVAGALWANLHGIAQLWRWGSLQLATGTDRADALLQAALDAHLGPAEPPHPAG